MLPLWRSGAVARARGRVTGGTSGRPHPAALRPPLRPTPPCLRPRACSQDGRHRPAALFHPSSGVQRVRHGGTAARGVGATAVTAPPAHLAAAHAPTRPRSPCCVSLPLQPLRLLRRAHWVSANPRAFACAACGPQPMKPSPARPPAPPFHAPNPSSPLLPALPALQLVCSPRPSCLTRRIASLAAFSRSLPFLARHPLCAAPAPRVLQVQRRLLLCPRE